MKFGKSQMPGGMSQAVNRRHRSICTLRQVTSGPYEIRKEIWNSKSKIGVGFDGPLAGPSGK